MERFDPLAALAGALVGVIVGSFLAVLAIRWEQGRSALWGRSRCDGCDRPLSPRRLVPIVSFLAARGRCDSCGAPIDRRHLALEIGGALVGALALGLAPDRAGVAGAVFGWMLLVLGAIDFACLWLPDRLTLPLTLGGLAVGAAGIQPGLFDRVVGLVVGFGALATLRAVYRRVRGREGLGGGDAKLLGGIGAWMGWQPLPWIVLSASLLGLAWFAWHHRRSVIDLRHELPLGTLLAAAAWALWLASPWLAVAG